MRKIVTPLVIVLMLAAFAQVSVNIDSYQGYHGGADCAVCHNEPATAWNETFADSDCEADGIADETFWDEHSTIYHTQYIPVAGGYGSGHTFVRTIFAQNSTHLFIKMDWEDLTLNGTEENKYDSADGVSIYWNMDGAVFDAGFPDGMVTEEGTLDVWTWKAAPMVETLPDGDVNLTETVAPVDSIIDHDYIMNTIGIGKDGSQDLTIGATYGNQGSHHEDSYQVEMVRPLETGEDTDIQFTESGYYTFGLALFDDSSGRGHLMGFEHQVWIYGGPVEDDTPTSDNSSSDDNDAPILGLIGLTLTLAALVVVPRFKRR